jgi:hypothetical protein
MRNDTCSDYGLLGVGGLHNHALKMARIIEFLSAQESEKQNVHEEHEEELLDGGASRRLRLPLEVVGGVNV